MEEIEKKVQEFCDLIRFSEPQIRRWRSLRLSLSVMGLGMVISAILFWRSVM